ncbi:MAG: acyl-CoA dehydrogenase [Propionibacterium sp.]|nr:acyl-CoA dehydrogenase [Propionibacterium sp.]
MSDETMNTTADADVVALINEVLGDHWDRTERTAGGLDADLWATLTETGLHLLTGSEAHGGAEAGWAEAAVLASRTAHHAARVPVVEHDLLAGWLVEHLGIEPDDAGLRTVAVLDADGRAEGVAWAPVADSIVLVWPEGDDWLAAVVPAGSVEIAETDHLAARPTGTVTAANRADLNGRPVSADLVAELRARASLARTLQICGAMERVIELATEHVTTRVQFGRALSKFQAVQFAVVAMANEAALARVAADTALHTALRDGFAADTTAFAVAAARSVAGHAVSVVVRNGHQVHGAIGTTDEHSLHLFTRAMLAWRSEWGTTADADRFLTERAVAAGSSGAWRMVLNSAG